MVLICAAVAAVCVLVQMGVKRTLDERQYGYMRDLVLAAAWVLLAVWLGSPQARFVVGVAFVGGTLGVAENLWPERSWLWGYWAIGLACALFGPSIQFISLVDNEYIYLTPGMSIVATTLWFVLFPFLMRQLDRISGLVGHVLAVTFSLMLMSVVLAGREMPDAFFMSFTGLALLGAFWSRFNNVYRQAGTAMSSVWGFLVAGTSILGVNKGIVFGSMFFLSLGLFAIPLTEVSLHLASLALSDTSHGTERLYRKMIRRGFDHSDAVRLIAALCAFLGTLAAFSSQASLGYVAWMWWGGTGIAALLVVLMLFFKYGRKSPMTQEKPCLWGVSIDNVSMNYALSKARGMLLSPKGTRLISTVNALGMNEALHDADYHQALRRSAMVLSDGVGLLWGLRFLGMPIQERVTGIDFAEQLCRMAAAEHWPVYFLGARGNTARNCARSMSKRYPGLITAGARDGYFSLADASVAEEVAGSGAKILFVAMGIPRQEKWIMRYSGQLGDILAVGVGGAFDVLAGQLKRAPVWVQKSGMEWLYRLFQEPWRWKRDLGLVAFVLRVVATRLGWQR